MTPPRVLVVRSGPDPFASADAAKLEIVERVSHTVESLEIDHRGIPARADLAVFSSRIAVDRALSDPGSTLARCVASADQVFAVGASTEAALRSKGIAKASAGGGSAQALLAGLPDRLEGKTVIFPCGADSLAELPEGLLARGARVIRIVLYRKVPKPPDTGLSREILERPFVAFCATAPSAAEWLFEGLGPAAEQRLRATPAVVLGMTTLRWLDARGVARIEVAPEASFPAAARRLEALATGRSGQ